MNNSKINSQRVNSLDVNNAQILEHSERTEWRERLIIARAKAVSLVVVVLFAMACLCICAFRMDNPETLIHAVTPVISGVLSFYAGRKSRGK